jgi:biopolymer transport protein TolR
MMAGSANRRVKSRFAPNSQINVTPFVDVMLVLLIVFMVAAPLMAVTVPVDLAKSEAKPKVEAKPLTVSVSGDGTIFIGTDKVPKDQVVASIQSRANGDLSQRIYLSGTSDVSYEQVMEIMGMIDAAGFTRIGLMGAQSRQLQ